MDWPNKPLSRNSFISGRTFIAGERVTCVIYRSPEGLQRADLTDAEAGEWRAPGEVLGKWMRAVESEEEAERERRKHAIESAEEMFLGLAREAGGAGEDKELLMQFLALMLERKRVLRPSGAPKDGKQRYTHTKLNEEFWIAQHELTPERVVLLNGQLEYLAS